MSSCSNFIIYIRLKLSSFSRRHVLCSNASRVIIFMHPPGINIPRLSKCNPSRPPTGQQTYSLRLDTESFSRKRLHYHPLPIPNLNGSPHFYPIEDESRPLYNHGDHNSHHTNTLLSVLHPRIPFRIWPPALIRRNCKPVSCPTGHGYLIIATVYNSTPSQTPSNTVNQQAAHKSTSSAAYTRSTSTSTSTATMDLPGVIMLFLSTAVLAAPNPFNGVILDSPLYASSACDHHVC